jgi:hypothetical protein
MNCKIFFDASVFPAPDSPAQTNVNRHRKQLHILLIGPIFSHDDDYDYDVMVMTITAIITMTTVTMTVLLKFIPEF